MYSSLNQTSLVKVLRTALQQALEPHFTEKSGQLGSFMTRLDLNDLLVMNAQRKSYGQTPKQFDLYADEAVAALWTWELASPSLYLESAHLKKVLSLRHSLNQQGQLI